MIEIKFIDAVAEFIDEKNLKRRTGPLGSPLRFSSLVAAYFLAAAGHVTTCDTNFSTGVE